MKAYGNQDIAPRALIGLLVIIPATRTEQRKEIIHTKAHVLDLVAA